MKSPSQLVILGGGGFIGQALVRWAVLYEIDILCISRSYQWSSEELTISEKYKFNDYSENN